MPVDAIVGNEERDAQAALLRKLDGAADALGRHMQNRSDMLAQDQFLQVASGG